MKKSIITILLSVLLLDMYGQRTIPVVVESPNKKVKVIVHVKHKKINIAVFKNKKQVFQSSSLGMTVDGINTGDEVTLGGTITEKIIDEKYALFGNHNQAINQCREVSIPLNNNKMLCHLVIRSYDDGIALRYILKVDKKTKIESDNTAFSMPASAECYWAYHSNDYENLHNQSTFFKMPEGSALLAPLTIKCGQFYLSLSEADCKNFPDMSWIKIGKNLKANFTTNPNGWEVEQGTITSPWRLAVIADDLTQLVNSDLIMNLCEAPNPSCDFSWVKPGRVLWQWWSTGSPKYEEQKDWYDAAARLTWEYYLIDDGWRVWSQPKKDQWQCLKDVVDYGNSQSVKSIIWVDSKEMRTREEIRAYLEKVKQTGAVGIKIDFIPAATPDVMQWYQAALEETYRLQLMCDFHGCVKPTGFRRTWPHEMTREAVRGNEYHITRYKRVMPVSQDEIIPFTRLIAGPADFTPVIFNKKEINGFSWVHELSQAIVYLSPLTHFADAYSEYVNNPAEDILHEIPTVWDETIVLSCSEIGKVAAFARRKGNEWWIGILNGDQISDITFDLKFIRNNNAKATILIDKENVSNDLRREERTINPADRVILKLQQGGGYFMRIK